jgi:parallel beta-helix repeat protein
MKLRRFAILSSVFVCFSITAPAFAATLIVDNDGADCPRPDFNSINAAIDAAFPGDKILVCPGTYVEAGSPQAAVVVDKPDLRIEAQAAPGDVKLQGTAAQQFGFHLLNITGVVLQGFTVEGFRTANIRIEGNGGNTLRKNVTTALVGPVASSIQVVNSSANIVEQNTAFANQCSGCNGISVSGAASSDNIIRHNETFLNNTAGVQTNGSGPRNVLFSNRSYSNTIGIRNILGSNGNVMENNYVFLNVAPAPTPDTPPVLVSGGIIVGASTGVIVRNNRSERNDAFGIRLQNGASNNLVEKNEVRENDQDGIRLESAAPGVAVPGPVMGNTVQLNLIRRNGRDGIRVFDPAVTGNFIERNVIRESVEHDAHDDSVGPGPGATLNFWIDNKCETENRPGLCEHAAD